MEMRFYFAIVLIVFVTSIACSRKSIRQLERNEVKVTKVDSTFILADSHSSLKIQYLGSGGLLFVQPGINIFIDPFFSHQHLSKLASAMMLGSKIKPKEKYISVAKDRILASHILSAAGLQNDTKAIFSAHGHYDHLMDFPFIFNNWFLSKPDVYVNSSSVNSIKYAMDSTKIFNLDKIASSFIGEGSSIDISGRDGTIFKVYPIFASHNPHVANAKFFSGSVQQASKKIGGPKYKSKINNWLEGRTMSFLIDIERNGNIELRMFVQSSSCEFPDGMPPHSLLKKKNVDIAFLGVASYHFSKETYPSAFLDSLNPKRIVFIHWEDFFRNYNKQPKTVLKTDVVKFFTALPKQYNENYFLPKPGVVFNIRY